jgi:hypothetical protein
LFSYYLFSYYLQRPESHAASSHRLTYTDSFGVKKSIISPRTAKVQPLAALGRPRGLDRAVTIDPRWQFKQLTRCAASTLSRLAHLWYYHPQNRVIFVFERNRGGHRPEDFVCAISMPFVTLAKIVGLSDNPLPCWQNRR